MKTNENIAKGRELIHFKLKNRCDDDTTELGLLKLPIDVLYSEALKEVGAQESYIEELSYTIKMLQSENQSLKSKLELFEFINEEERLKIENDKNYLNKAASRNKLAKENKSLREDISKLIFKLSMSHNEIILLKERLAGKPQTE